MPRNVICFLLAALASAWAQAADNVWVRDQAGILSESNRAYLGQLMQTVQQKTSAEVIVMTVPSLEGMDVDTYTTRMFNKIGIGKKSTNNGVLFLTAPGERRTRIEVGYGLEPLLTDAVAGAILDNHVIPQFRKNDLPAGIVKGAEAIAALLQRYPVEAMGVPDSAPDYLGSVLQDYSQKTYLAAAICTGFLLFLYLYIQNVKRFPAIVFYGLLMFAGGVAIVAITACVTLGDRLNILSFETVTGGSGLLVTLIMNLRLYSRYRARACESCGGPMELLSESDEDQHLSTIQQLEENLRSIDYDVWHCPACLKTDTEEYIESSSLYKSCPQCHGRTLKETRITLAEATTFDQGKVRVNGACRSCSYQESRVVRTPCISESSDRSSGGSSGGGSSGGGSPSGGSSGGGGSSRSW